MNVPAEPAEPLGASRAWRPVLVATAVSASVLLARLVPLVRAHRLPDPDELHTLVNARLLLAGEALPPSTGLLTSYEGGSWLIAWPVSWAMALGLQDVQASAWTAAVIALLAVVLTSLWLGRLAGWGAAAAFGPLVALTSPQLTFYAIRAWGSLPEAMLAAPLLVIALTLWTRRGRPLVGAAGLGALLAGAIVLSYLHMLTALAFVVIQLLERGQRPWRRVAAEVGLAAGVAVVLWGGWLVVSSAGEPGWPVIRGDRSLGAAFGPLLLPRLDRVLLGMPRAWYGHLPGFGARELVAGVALSGLAISAALVTWRRGGPRRWLVVWCAALLPGISVGLWMGGPDEAPRYYLPLLAGLLALIAAWDLRATAAALLLGLLLWWPSQPRAAPESVDLAYLDLGAFGLVDDGPDPHAKFRLMLGGVEPWHRAAFATGYGFDAGARGFPVLTGEQPSEPTVRRELYFGLGCGLLVDGGLGREESLRLEQVTAMADRAALLEGLGAALAARPEASPDEATRQLLLGELSGSDWEALGRGSAQVGAPLAPSSLALEDEDLRGRALARGVAEAQPVRRARALRLMERPR